MFVYGSSKLQQWCRYAIDKLRNGGENALEQNISSPRIELNLKHFETGQLLYVTKIVNIDNVIQ